MNKELNYEEIVKKIEEMKKGKNFDLSTEEDMAVAIMNLISLEEHFFFTGSKTDKPEYFDLLIEVRSVRTKLLAKMIDKTEGETWCISKHLLAASMRLMEVGTKAHARGKKEEAEDLFKKSYQLYSLFWGLNLKLIDMGEVKKIDDNQITKKDDDKKGIMAKLGTVVQKVIDCCKE